MGVDSEQKAFVSDAVNDYLALIADYFERVEMLDRLVGLRRVRRRRDLSATGACLRNALDCYEYDDEHSDEGFEELNEGRWCEQRPVADRCLRDFRLAFEAEIAWAELLREFARFEAVTLMRPRWLPSPEPRVNPPSRVSRSEPDLALAPPLYRVALPSDDVIAAAA